MPLIDRYYTTNIIRASQSVAPDSEDIQAQRLTEELIADKEASLKLPDELLA